MRRAVAGLVLLVAACGGGDTAPTTVLPSSEAPASSSASTDATTTTTTVASTTAAAPAVLSLSSGRGDDDTFEVTIWFAADPFAADDYRVVVGADVDLAYPGVGDPFTFLNGHLELTPNGAALMLADEVLAEGDAINELVSWGLSENVLRVFFIETTPARGGTTWVIVENDGERVEFGTAGAPFGTACSYHSAGLDLGVSGVPDAGTACRYP